MNYSLSELRLIDGWLCKSRPIDLSKDWFEDRHE